MTQEIYVGNIKEVLRSKGLLEKELEISLTNKGKLVFIDGSGENEYLGLKVLEAINLGFSAEKALELKDEEVILHVLNIKDITKRNDIERVRARIIGTEGKTLSTLETLTDCNVCLHNNQVGIIGNVEAIESAIIGVRCLIQGSKQANVYTKLEHQKKERRLNPESSMRIKNELKSRRKTLNKENS
ncbi:MAG: hypothetical protein WC979_09585 [Candidatus Pacearchaeota archaeon]|jgi:ribosomal RNA assembly protein